MDVLALTTDGYANTPSSGGGGTIIVFPNPPPPPPLTAEQAQSLLVRALQLPLPPFMTEAKGIFQSDVIIRTAIIMALADMRANPTLVDYAFASLPDDDTTASVYGEKTVAMAKEWFLRTEIPVFITPRKNDSLTFPCITIALRDSVEVENTLGDVHYQPWEDLDTYWPIIAGPFVPKAYSAGTGIMVVPDAIRDSGIAFSTDMVVVDKVGKNYPITSVLDKAGFTIQAGIVSDFSQVTVRGAKPAAAIALESAGFRETYTAGAHTPGETQQLIWLHSLLTFALLRYRQTLMEARGFERSSVSSGEIAEHENMGEGHEHVYSRYITLTGYVRQYWPKSTVQKIAAITSDLDIHGANALPGFDDTVDSIGPPEK